MTDNYPTRKEPEGRFIKRNEPVDYSNNIIYDDYVRNGFVYLYSFLDRDKIASLLDNHIDTGLVTMEPKIDQIRSITGLHNKNSFRGIARNKGLINLVKDILGSGIYIHQSRINFKSGIESNGWHWHSDFETWHAQDGMPGMRCLTAMIPLTGNTELNGPLMVVPGSHHFFYSCRKERQYSAQENFSEQREGIPDTKAMYEIFKRCNNQVEMILCKPGDVILFDCNIIHGSTQNMTPFNRTNLFFVYNSIENKLVEPFSVDKPRPEEMGTRSKIEAL